MAKKKVQEIVEDYFRDCSDDWMSKYELYDVEFVKEGQDYYLRVYIDKKDGEYMGTEDCETVSRNLSDWLDNSDPIEQNYYLEVSSPGLDRVLRKPEHFIKYMGSEVEVSLYKPIDGEKKITGILKEYKEDNLTVELGEGNNLILSQKDIAKVNLVFNWGETD